MYRTIDVSIWQEMWFEELKPSTKLLFFYLLTNTRQSACGACRISMRSVSHETSLSVSEILEAITELCDLGKLMWWDDSGWFFLTRFYRHQRAQASRTYTVAAQRAAATTPDDVYESITTLYPELIDPKRGYGYPTDTLSPTPPPTLPQQLTVTGSVKTESGSATEARDVPRALNGRRTPEEMTAYEPELFSRLWAFYGKHGSCERAAREWEKLEPSRELMQKIRLAIEGQRAAFGWGEPGGQAQPHLSTWLHDRRWDWEAIPNKVQR